MRLSGWPQTQDRQCEFAIPLASRPTVHRDEEGPPEDSIVHLSTSFKGSNSVLVHRFKETPRQPTISSPDSVPDHLPMFFDKKYSQSWYAPTQVTGRALSFWACYVYLLRVSSISTQAPCWHTPLLCCIIVVSFTTLHAWCVTV